MVKISQQGSKSARVDVLYASQIFIQVVELGSLSKVAHQFNLSVSSVSRQLSQLEQYLGVSLLQRSTRSIAITDEGHLFLQEIRQILQDLEQVTHRLADPEQSLQGLVSCVVPDVLLEQLCQQVPDFLAQYPKIRLQLLTSHQVEDSFQPDLWLDRVPHKDRHWQSIRLSWADKGWVLVAAPEYLRQYPPLGPLEDLKQHQCLLTQPNTDQEVWLLEDEEGIYKITVNGSLCCPEWLTRYQCVKQGLGLAMLPHWLVKRDLQVGRLHACWPQLMPRMMHLSEPDLFLNVRAIPSPSPRVNMVREWLEAFH